MLLSVVYVALKGILQLVSLLFRSADSKELEIIVLRAQSIAASGLTASSNSLPTALLDLSLRMATGRCPEGVRTYACLNARRYPGQAL